MEEPGLLSPLSAPVRIGILAYFDVPSLGRWASCCHIANGDAAMDLVWADAFERTCCARGRVSEDVQALISRPFGADAIGWRVSVYSPEHNRCFCGSIRDYRRATNEYFVQYDQALPDGRREVWELEARNDREVRNNPSLASLNRIRFLLLPSPSGPILGAATLCGGSAARRAKSGSHSSRGDRSNHSRSSSSWSTAFSAASSPFSSSPYSTYGVGTHGMGNGSFAGFVGNEGNSSPASTSVELPVDHSLEENSGSGSMELRSCLWKPKQGHLRFATWREELRHTVSYTPSRLLHRLADHRDEVLFVAFSPCGSRLATCSRDQQTGIYRFDADGRPTLGGLLKHASAAVHAQWWPAPPHHRLAVCTDGPRFPCAEVWDVEANTLLLAVLSPIRDVYASLVRWPAADPSAELALLASGDVEVGEDYRQQLRIYSVPEVAEPAASGPPVPVAQPRLRNALNYFHCLEPAATPDGPDGRLVALTGAGPRQCDAVALIDLASVPVELATSGAPIDLEPRMCSLPNRAVLIVRWAAGGRLLLANTRPRVGGASPASSGTPGGGETVMEALRRPAPPLGTAIELVVLDAHTLETLSVHGGHYAFTTAEAPFIVHADAWADADIVASGGEDRCVHVWHRRHGRQLQLLEGHSQPVNAVSWCETHGLLASASDDRSVILWASTKGTAKAAIVGVDAAADATVKGGDAVAAEAVDSSAADLVAESTDDGTEVPRASGPVLAQPGL